METATFHGSIPSLDSWLTWPAVKSGLIFLYSKKVWLTIILDSLRYSFLVKLGAVCGFLAIVLELFGRHTDY